MYDQGETAADGYGRFIHLGIDPHEEVQVDDQRQTDRQTERYGCGRFIHLGHWPS